MTSRDRIIRTLDRKSVDRVPYSFDLTSYINNILAAHYGVLPGDLPDFIKDDLLYVSPGGFERERSDASYVNEFGVRWDVSGRNRLIGDWGSILEHPLPAPTLEGYNFPAGDDVRRFAHLDSGALKTQVRFVILGMCGLFDLCWHLRGFENFLTDMAEGGGFSDKLLDGVLEYSLELVSVIPDCVDGVRVGEDWGLQKGLITGKAAWVKYLKPRLKILYGAIRARGFRLFIHSCGDITEIFPDIIEIGVEAVHPVQPEAMDIAALHREYGEDVTMYGGIGTQSVLVFGTPDDVVAEAKSRLELFSGGGYILGPAGAISTDAKPENAIALVDFAMSL